MILGIFIKDKDISYQERRKLAKLPTDWNTVLDEDSTFFDDLDDYFLDQFPFRDWFRKVKGIASVKLFNKKIEHQVFVQKFPINYLFHELSYIFLHMLYNIHSYISPTFCLYVDISTLTTY